MEGVDALSDCELGDPKKLGFGSRKEVVDRVDRCSDRKEEDEGELMRVSTTNMIHMSEMRK
jgi:hypothetical protein